MNISDKMNITSFKKTNMTASDNINAQSSIKAIAIYIVACPLVLWIHFLALALLRRNRNFEVRQKYLKVALFCTEIVLSIQLMLRAARYYHKNILLDVAALFGESAGTLMYIFLMTFITLDRLAEVKLNLKYPIYCTAKRTNILLFLAFTVSILLFLGLLTMYLVDKTHNKVNWINWKKFLFRYLLPTLQGVFLIIASSTYIYIFKKLRKNRIALRKIVNQLNKNPKQEEEPKKTQKNPKIFVPSLIILTFILFSILPQYLWLATTVGVGSTTEKLSILFPLVPILYFLGWCLDPIIYILSIKSIQQTIRQCVRSPKWWVKRPAIGLVELNIQKILKKFFTNVLILPNICRTDAYLQ